MEYAERVCVIGAGSSGIAACQVLHARKIPFDCFEAGTKIGGNWRYLNDNGMSSAYRSLHINSSRKSMQYASWPMPAHYPHYVDHKRVVQYFDDFVEHFGFGDRIRFGTTVQSVEPDVEGGWNVTTSDREGGATHTTRYAAVLVATGHHWDPRLPTPPFSGADTFTGEQTHSHHYRTPEFLTGKRVLVLGIGNSASDIAVESSVVATRTILATRRGAHVVPKFIAGIPTDHLTLSRAADLPLRVQSAVLGAILRLARGKITRYGLPEPDHRVLHAHPTASDMLLTKLAHEDIIAKPNIDRFEGSTVRFVDGSTEEIDIVVYCTGYNIRFPFLDPAVLDPQNNKMALYQRVIPLQWPGLYFIGLVQPIGAIMPMAEAQAEFVADLLEGVITLPRTARMNAEISQYQERLARRYVPSLRHTIQVDSRQYLRKLRRERTLGALRKGTSRALKKVNADAVDTDSVAAITSA